jgi:hypothetical protein
MSTSRTAAMRLACVTSAGAVALIAACHRAEPPALEPPPALPSAQMAPPILTPVTPSQLAPDTAREKHVDIDTHGTEQDVRMLLDFVAKAGNFSLVYAPNLNRKVRVSLNDVPVSVAFQTLLAMAGLSVESSGGTNRLPSSASVVFYQLPVNVDSMSVDAIMKRFGIGREIAELLVKARTDKP